MWWRTTGPRRRRLPRPARCATARCRQALTEALLRDPSVFMMGEDIGAYGGGYAVSMGLLAEFGPDRIRDTPLSESAFTGAGIGAALAGMRPIVEIMTANFALLAQPPPPCATCRTGSSACRW